MEPAIKALAEANRRQILELVAGEERSAGDIARHFAVSRSAVSQHLAVLKDAGLVEARREGTRRLYRARPPGIAAVKLYLDGLFDDRLARLREVAEAKDRGTSRNPTERLSVEREIGIRARPSAVWALLTDARAATRWMGVVARLDPTPGGVYRVEVVPGHAVAGTFVEVDPPQRLAHTWGWEDQGPAGVPTGSTLVRYDLVPTGRGTILRLTHAGLPHVGAAGSHSRGWGHYLPRLAAVAAGGRPGPDPWARDPARLAAELGPGSEPPKPKEEGMSTQETIEAYFEDLKTKGRWADHFAEGMAFISHGTPAKAVSGRDAFVASTRGFYRMIRGFEVRRLLVDGPRACALTRYRLEPPTGEPFESDVAEVFSVADGRIDSLAIYFDSAPYPEPPEDRRGSS